ncbi:unnamed protein product [Chondrus crispus]|uniref:Uncharacterized protein n=1 Tax=Chondrus crispus TaxID=2769 RepID=R7QGU3_CHOCR|nr:unnamed protein product [Chondrus crispus]CDF36635.1 unnamed protein product [Chondrus crispus]|eukprot:XP_005716454.1 unnamed protein product [Chondrus crispus]
MRCPYDPAILTTHTSYRGCHLDSLSHTTAGKLVMCLLSESASFLRLPRCGTVKNLKLAMSWSTSASRSSSGGRSYPCPSLDSRNEVLGQTTSSLSCSRLVKNIRDVRGGSTARLFMSRFRVGLGLQYFSNSLPMLPFHAKTVFTIPASIMRR